ncbi:hypothetical protein PSHT_15380, partial [Puccinia striiformis]
LRGPTKWVRHRCRQLPNINQDFVVYFLSGSSPTRYSLTLSRKVASYSTRMLALLKCLIFFVVFHHIGCAVLSSLDDEAHVLQDSPRTLPDLDHQVEASNAVGPNEYGIALDGSHGNKAEGERELGNGSMARNRRIDLKTNEEITFQLESFREATIRRRTLQSGNLYKNKLTEFKVPKEKPDRTKAEYRPMPSKLIKSSKIFQLKYLMEMVEFHIDLLFLKNGQKFFDSPDSVIPQLEFMTTGLAFKHFHGFIEGKKPVDLHQSVKLLRRVVYADTANAALSVKDKKQVVYVALKTTLSHVTECFPQKGQLSRTFLMYREMFLRTGFPREADLLATDLKKTGALNMNHLPNRGNDLETVNLINHLINHLRLPSSKGAQSRIELQLVFYMLSFLRVLPTNHAGNFFNRRDRSPFEIQLEFMSSYLNFFRNRDQYPQHFYQRPNMMFVLMAKNPNSKPFLRRWIEGFILDIFEHDSWYRSTLHATTPKEKFTTWMGKIPDAQASSSCVFLSLILLEIGASVLSGLDGEAHAARDPVRTFPGVDQAESSNVAQIVSTPAASTQEHQPRPKQYGIIPDGLSERNDERERMRIGRLETKVLIASLHAGSDDELSSIKKGLDDLYNAFKIPIIERLYPLSGLGPPITLLLPKSKPARPSRVSSLVRFLTPGTKARWLSTATSQLPNHLKQAARLRRFVRLSEARKQSRKLVPSIWTGKSPKPATKHINTNEHLISSPTVTSTLSLTPGKSTKFDEPQSPHDPESLHQNQLVTSNRLSSATAEISQQTQLPITKPSAPSKDSSPTERPRLLELVLEAKGVQLGKPPSSSPRSGVLEGNELESVNDVFVDDRTKIWNSLQDKLIKLKSFQNEEPETPKDPTFQLIFLKSLYLMGDYIFTHGLMPAKFIESIEIFNAKTLTEMVKFHIQLLFIKRGENFFDAPDSVIPELEFLITGSEMKHFHRSIKALPAEDQKHVVYAALSATLYHTPGCFPRRDIQVSDWFTEISRLFRRPELLEQLDGLSASLKDSADMDDLLNKRGNFPIVQLVNKLINYFRSPSWRNHQRKLEYQLVYYILEFLEDNYKPVMVAMLRRRREDLIFYQKQLKCLRTYLKFYRNRNQYPSHIYENPDMTFLALIRSDYVLFKWVFTYVADTFEHKSWYELRGTTPERQFTLWMSDVYNMRLFLSC